MKKKTSRLLAYFYMPAIFLIVGTALLYVLLLPLQSTGQAISQLLFSSQDIDTPALAPMVFTEPEVKTVVEQKNTLDIKTVQWPVSGDQYGRLQCSKIGLDVVVYWGDSSEILRKGPGTYTGSGIPGNGRTILIGGHNTMEFTCLQNIAAGDVITFTTNYGIYEYEITDVKVLQHDDPNAFDLRQKKEELVLYTCYPFTELGATTQRCFVYGKKIAGPDLVRSEEADRG